MSRPQQYTDDLRLAHILADSVDRVSAMRFRDRPVFSPASAALFAAVRAELDLMDEADRPALFVCGESLGAFASQSVFSSVEEALSQVDGALWVGTPAFTPMPVGFTLRAEWVGATILMSCSRHPEESL